MKDFYLKPIGGGYHIVSANGIIITEWMLDKRTAQMFLALLNNMVNINNGDVGDPQTIAQMFFSDLAALFLQKGGDWS